MLNKILLLIGLFVSSQSIFAQNSVKIGELVWTTQNLNVSTFRNGDIIPEANSKEEWLDAVKTKKPAYCYKDFDSKNGVKYGKLYNYYAVEDPRGLAPSGWAIPREDDVYDLQNSTNSNATSGSKFKSKSGWKNYSEKETCPLCEGKTLYCSKCQGTGEVWVSYSGNGSNQTGFSAVPGCSVDDWFGTTFDEGSTVFWISNSKNASETKAGCLKISYDDAFLIYNGGYLSDKENKGKGFSVRCVKETKEYLDYYSEKQRLANEKAKNDEKLRQPQIMIENQLDKIFKIRKNAKSYLENNQSELYLRVQEILFNEWHRLDSFKIALNYSGIIQFDMGNNFDFRDYFRDKTFVTFPQYYMDVQNLIWNLILNEKLEEALDVANRFMDKNYNSQNGGGLNMKSFKLLCEDKDRGALKWMALYVSILNETKYTMRIMQEFMISRASRETKHSNDDIQLTDFDKLENKGIIIPDAQYIKFTLKALIFKWRIKISPNAKSKSWLQNYSSDINKYLDDELYDKNKKITELVVKIEDNLYKSKIDSYNIYYYLDKTGAAFLVTKSAASISTEDEAKLIIKAKQIRDKDLGVASPKK
jgi:uncharacterized protein (TIGR02145 family)